MKKKAIAIVAHPDDETIWMGGTILRFRDYDWTIFSLCRASDADRVPKFRKVCKFYGARCIIADLEDEKVFPVGKNEISKIILQNLKERKYDIIFTHNRNGEYGHRRHVEVHDAIVSMVEQNILKAKKLLCFSYELGDEKLNSKESRIALPKISDMNIELTREEHRKKLKVINESYGFSKNSFEFLCSHDKECFEKVK